MRVRKKKGFSIVEVVIALTVIVIVTFSALSIIMASTTKRVNAINKTEAQNFASDILECFKASNSFSEFQDNVYYALDESLKDTNWETEKDDDDNPTAWAVDTELQDGRTMKFYTYSRSGMYKAKVGLFDDGGRQAIAIIVMENKTEIDIDFSDIFYYDISTGELKSLEKSKKDEPFISFAYKKGGGVWTE